MTSVMESKTLIFDRRIVYGDPLCSCRIVRIGSVEVKESIK